jgi:hypothetical protein
MEFLMQEQEFWVVVVLSMLVSILEQVQGNSIFHISWLYKGMFGCLAKKKQLILD